MQKVRFYSKSNYRALFRRSPWMIYSVRIESILHLPRGVIVMLNAGCVFETLLRRVRKRKPLCSSISITEPLTCRPMEPSYTWLIYIYIYYIPKLNQAFSLVDCTGQYFPSYCTLQNWTKLHENRHVIKGIQHSGTERSNVLHSAWSNRWTHLSGSFTRFDQLRAIHFFVLHLRVAFLLYMYIYIYIYI